MTWKRARPISCRMPRIPLVEERLTRSVIGAFFEVYNTLGFGFLEHIYVMALERELVERGHVSRGRLASRCTTKGTSSPCSEST